MAKENSNDNINNLFNLLLDQKVKVKYIDEGHTKSISGTVKNADSVYLVLERPGGDPMFINHSIVSRIIPIPSFEEPDDGHHMINDDKKKNNGRR